MRLTVKLAVVVVTLAVAASTAGASVNAPKPWFVSTFSP